MQQKECEKFKTVKVKGNIVSMANKTIDALIFCPFYMCESKKSITCEGIIGKATTNHFISEGEKKYHEYNFCCSKHCRGCALHSALMDNYDDSVPHKVRIRH